MSDELKRNTQDLQPLDPKNQTDASPNVSDAATTAEVAVCSGPMPAIGLKKGIFQVATVKIGDVIEESSHAIPGKFKDILLTTDLSPNAEAAAPFAVALAKQSGGTIHLFHAIEDDPMEALLSGVVIGASAWLKSVREQRREQLAKMATTLGGNTGLTITQTCVTGHPAIEAVKFAQKIHADVIVLSTHGRTGIPHLFLGSVAEKIVRLSPIPVLTVRPGEAVPDEFKFKTILVPTDFSENSKAAIIYAVKLAKPHGAKLILAHVVENATNYCDPASSACAMPDVNKWMEFLKAQGEKKLAEDAAWLASKSDIAAMTELKYGRADEEICNMAREYKVDLVVMSTHGHTGFSHFAFGSVAERVLRKCPVPILSIRPIGVPIKSETAGASKVIKA